MNRIADSACATRTSTPPRCARRPGPACSPAATPPATTWPASPRRPPDSPGSQGRIPFENGFISEVLGEQGWNTYAVGKWHLTPGDEVDMSSWRAPLAARPRLRTLLRVPRRRNQPVVPGPRLRQPHHRATGDARGRLPPLERTSPTTPSEFVRDAKAVAPDKPWFMYYCPGAGHAPHHVFEEWADKYHGRVRPGVRGHPRRHPGPPEGAGPAPGRHRAVADQPPRRADRQSRARRATLAPARLRAAVGLARRRREEAVHPDGRGLCRVHQLHRPPDRAAARLPRRIGPARQHHHRGGLRQRRRAPKVARTDPSTRTSSSTTFPTPSKRTCATSTSSVARQSYNHYSTGWAWAFDTPFPYWKRFAGYEGGTADMLPAVVAGRHRGPGRGARTIRPRRRRRPHALRPAGHRPRPERSRATRRATIEGESFAAVDHRYRGPERHHPVLFDARAAGAVSRRLAGQHAASPPLGWSGFDQDDLGALPLGRGPHPVERRRCGAPRTAASR